MSDLGSMVVMEFADLTINTMIHEKNKTTMVRKAVARSESVFLIPHLASIDVRPAKTADKITAMSQNTLSPQLFVKIFLLAHLTLYHNFCQK